MSRFTLFLASTIFGACCSVRRRGPGIAVLHVGPGKMATTMIQWSVLRDTALFTADQYSVLPGKDIPGKILISHQSMAAERPGHNLGFCLRTPTCRSTDTWTAFTAYLKNASQHHQNILISSEVLSHKSDQHLLATALAPWHVRLVVGYRRFYEWLPSIYFQTYNPIKSEFHTWPEFGGTVVPSFSEYCTSFKKKKNTFLGIADSAWTSGVLHNYRNFSNVSILNLHDGDILSSFYCVGVPHARHACAATRRDQSPHDVFNPSAHSALAYDTFAVAAYNAGLVNASLPRNFVAAAIKWRQEARLNLTHRDFPHRCLPSQAQAELLEFSLHYERKLLPDFYATAEGEAALRQGFALANSSGLFCSIDAERVLSDPLMQPHGGHAWERFFKVLMQNAPSPRHKSLHG